MWLGLKIVFYLKPISGPVRFFGTILEWKTVRSIGYSVN